MNYTTNYHLPQWVESDRILMEDFNDAMAGIDQGLQGAKAAADTAESKANAAQAAASDAQGTANNAFCPTNMPFVTGNYTGTGSIVTITTGFKPSLVIVYEVGPNDSTEDTLGSTSIFTGGGVSQKLLINDDGFQAWRDSSDTHPRVNRRSHQYNYVAFR